MAIITGDSQKAAERTAQLLGIDTFFAQVLPEDKHRYVEQMKAEGRRVIMVGDGINDAPALAAANVSVAMSDASDIARETADVTLRSEKLRDLAELRTLHAERSAYGTHPSELPLYRRLQYVVTRGRVLRSALPLDLGPAAQPFDHGNLRQKHDSAERELNPTSIKSHQKGGAKATFFVFLWYIVYDIICRSNNLFFKESRNEQIEVLYEQSIRIPVDRDLNPKQPKARNCGTRFRCFSFPERR